MPNPVVLQHSHLPQTINNRQADNRCLLHLLHPREMHYPQPLTAGFHYLQAYFPRPPLALARVAPKMTTMMVNRRLTTVENIR